MPILQAGDCRRRHKVSALHVGALSMAQKRNYQKEMEEFLAQNRGRKLLLHCCCAPCATHCIACVEQKLDTTLYFYNPDIMMRENDKSDCRSFGGTCVRQSAGYAASWRAAMTTIFFCCLAAGREREREGGERCRLCISMRLEQTGALCGGKTAMSCFGTTLTVSPHKDAEYINTAGHLAC